MAQALSPERAAGGRFGPYGGRYVPETLVAALDDLAALYDAARAEPAFWAEFDALAGRVRGAPVTPLGRAAPFGRGRHTGAAQARRPQSHRRAQDQQHDRPGAAGAPDGQAADHRGDRCGAARRRHGHGVRALRARVRGVHGRGGRGPSGAQRLPHAAPGRDGRCRSSPARGRSRTRPTRRCATGSPTSPRPTTSSVRWSVPIPIREWCATSSR